VAIDYFTKWVEAISLKIVTSAIMIEFIKEHIIYRFGNPQTITIDQGKMFTSKEFEDFATNTSFKLINSSPYYAQANGQAEASNQILIKLITKKISENPRKWHLTLNETLWSYRMACHGSTKCSPSELVYGHSVVLPWKTKIGSRRVLLQDNLKADDYKCLVMDNLEDLHCHRLKALENIEANKLRITKYYDKKVKYK
jgi:transposase InsO family protein